MIISSSVEVIKILYPIIDVVSGHFLLSLTVIASSQKKALTLINEARVTTKILFITTLHSLSTFLRAWMFQSESLLCCSLPGDHLCCSGTVIATNQQHTRDCLPACMTLSTIGKIVTDSPGAISPCTTSSKSVSTSTTTKKVTIL